MIAPVTASTPKLYIGIDNHKKSWKVHFCTDLFDGATKRFDAAGDGLKKYVSKHFAGYEVSCAYEAGCCGYSAARLFQSYGWQVKVVNPADIPRPGKQAFVKTDKIDCINIAKQLKNGALNAIHIPTVRQEQLRWLFRRRFDLVKDMRRIKSRIKSALLFHGVVIPDELDNPNWTKAFEAWLEALQWQYEPARQALESMLCQYRFIDQQLRLVSKQIRAYCRKNHKDDYFLLRSVPGVGPLVAAAFICEIGQLRRFSSFKAFASYIGLAPGIYQSGDNYKTKGITPRAQQILRSYMVEAAWIAVRRDPVMQAYYRKHIGKDPKRIIVKVARKLLSKLFGVLKSGNRYEIGVTQ
jgi:transposase